MTAVTPMLKAAAQGPIPGPSATETSGETGSVALGRSLTSVERLAGLEPIAARSTAMLAVSDRDAALGQIARVEPPAMTADALCGHLRFVLAQLRALRSSQLQRAA